MNQALHKPKSGSKNFIESKEIILEKHHQARTNARHPANQYPRKATLTN